MDTPQDTVMGDATPSIPSVPLFRPNKKRKIYRQRGEDTKEADESPNNLGPQTIDDLIAGARAQAEEKELAEILRLRKQKKLRNGGVEFRPDGTTSQVGQAGGDMVLHEGDAAKQAEIEAIQKVVDRFAPQVGIMGGSGIVDKHMMSYIDSQLAKRQVESGQSREEAQSNLNIPSISNRFAAEQSTRPTGERQPASFGKLQEIDLGDEVREYNMSRTRKQLDGEELATAEISTNPKSKTNHSKPRPGLGPDGKPWRPRKPHRRNSEDIRRDALVEEVLRENRIELYDEPAGFAPGKGIYNAEEEDGAADDRIAEEFKREFMDAVSQRQRRRAVPEVGKKGGPASKLTREEELMKGPKLGGSKAQRAVMREMVLKGEIPPPRVRK